MSKRHTTLVLLSFICWTNSSYAFAEEGKGKPFETQIQIHSKGPTGPYSIRATVESKEPDKVTALMNQMQKAGDKTSSMADKSKGLSPEQKKQMYDDFLDRWFTGAAASDVPMGDPTTTAFINEAIDVGTMQNDANSGQKPPVKDQQQNQMGSHHHGNGPEGHHHGSGPEGHHSLPTDGSPNSEAITTQAIETFYNGLPPDVTERLSGMGVDPLATVHGAGDPYAPYAIAMHNGDYTKMRNMANSDNVTDWNERIAMLGLAGATALKDLSNPNNPNRYKAQDALRKIAEDLQYAGQGLGTDNPNDAKLKATCEDISRIWNNMTSQGQKPAGQ